MKRGFTLLELIIVIIIIGVLATLGFTQYTKMVEKGRAAEAKSVLGTLRTAEKAYQLEKGSFTATIADTGVGAPAACATSHYFYYTCDATAGTCTATRCTTGGKPPDFSGTAYSVTIDIDAGTLSSPGGY